LGHCRSIRKMHYTLIVKCIQPKGWIMVEKRPFRNILCYVGKGWLSISTCRARSQPFWTQLIFTFGSERIGEALLHACPT
jgi:hypothetical protein